MSPCSAGRGAALAEHRGGLGMPCHLAPAERWRWRCGRCRLRGAPRVPGAVRNLLGTVSGVGLDDLDVLDDVFCRGAVQLLLFDLEGIGPPT